MFGPGVPAATVIFLVTIAASLLGLYASPRIIQGGLFRPYFFIREKQYDTMFTSGFIHADLGHLLFNMITFYFFAFPLERILGTIPFVVLYFVGLALSHICTLHKHKNNKQYASLGASGAISAVLFAFIVYQPMTSLFIFPIPFPVPAVLFALLYVGYSYYSAQKNVGRINHDAHLCGAVSGLGFVMVYDGAAYGRLFSFLAG